MRELPDNFEDALQTTETTLDVARARQQHVRHRELLESLGIEVVEIPAEPACPDSPFIEDTAVVASAGRVLLTCPGAESRRGEVTGVRRALEDEMLSGGQKRFPKTSGMELSSETILCSAGGKGHAQNSATPSPVSSSMPTLDGGDVLRAGRTFFVGRSSRTSESAFRWFKEELRGEGLDIVAVDVLDGLHLKSAVTLLDESLAIVYPGQIDTRPLVDAGLGIVEAVEPEGANVLALPPNRVIMSSSAPRTMAAVERLGYEVIPLDLDELHKADGALTCCSLRVPGPGEWCV